MIGQYFTNTETNKSN